MTKKVAAATVGCKVNLYDTNAVLQKFADNGYEVVDLDSSAFIDVCVINTCCVTNEAERKSRQIVRRAKTKGAIVVAMGCASQLAVETFRDIGADIVVGTTNRMELFEQLADFVAKPLDGAGFGYVDKISNRTRGFLKIQDGCDNFCTYCIVPYARGASRSRPLDEALQQAQQFVTQGCKEIVISGIHIASYGKDFKDEHIGLLHLLERVSAIESLRRIRLSSVEPSAINAEFLSFAAACNKLANHIHLSLQSGCERILQQMNRRYTIAEYAAAVASLRDIRPQISITTDVIVGFPGETDAEHAETLDFVRNMRFADVHVFPYSAKKGTQAAQMLNQVDGSVKKRRAGELLALAGELKTAHLGTFIGCSAEVLIETKDADGFCIGKTDGYIQVKFLDNKTQYNPGDIVDVMLETMTDTGFEGLLS